MTDKVRHYNPTNQPVEAVLLTRNNYDDVANWCGGESIYDPKSSDPTDVYIAVKYPTLKGVNPLKVGQYLVKDKQGRFSSWDEASFNEAYMRAQRDRDEGFSYPPGVR